MKKCLKCSEKELSAYLDNQLVSNVYDRVDAHLQACEVCQDSLAELKEVQDQIQSLPTMELSQDFDVSFKSALLLAEQEKKAAQKVPYKESFSSAKIIFGLPMPLQVAAVVVLGLAFIFGGKQTLFPSTATYLGALKGDVEIKRQGASEWKTVSKTIRLRAGDAVRTAKNSQAVIESKDIYQAKLFEQSEWIPFSLASNNKNDSIEFRLRKGNLFVETGDRFPGREMNVIGPSGKATVVGTTFMVRALPNGLTTLSVEEGKVRFAGKKKENETWVSRFESSKVAPSGNPKLSQPLSEEEFLLFSKAKPEMLENATNADLVNMVEDKRKMSSSDLRVWQNRLLKESDIELASYGFYLIGEVQEEMMAPAEALQQYVSVLSHFPNSVESSWAFEFLRDKLELVPKDRHVTRQEMPATKYGAMLKKVGTADSLTSGFLKGLEPQRKFLSSEFWVKSEDGTSYLVNRAITFERQLGEKQFRPVGYLDSVKDPKTKQLLLRIGKLFSYKGDSNLLSEMNTAVFHPKGKLIYTIERDLYYSGKKPIGYQEVYKGPGGAKLAVLSRQVQNWNRSGQPIRYQEALKNNQGKALLTRKRSNIRYGQNEAVIDYEDELVDVENRLAFERGRDQLKVAVGEQRLSQSDLSGFDSMDEVMRTLKKMQGGRPSRFESDMESGTPFSRK